MANTKFGIGQSLTPVENTNLVQGKGIYTEDFNCPNALHLFVFRANIAHGIIKKCDVSMAEQADGVRLIITPELLKSHKIKDIPCETPVRNIDDSQHIMIHHPILAKNFIKHTGEAIVGIIADSLNQARDAAELIVLEVDELPALATIYQAIAKDAPSIWQECPDNINFTWGRGNGASTDAAINSADKVLEFAIVNNRVSANPMENRNCLAFFDEDNKLTLHVPSQGVHRLHRSIAELMHLNIQEFRVITGDVGGGFGMKIFVYGEYILALLASKLLNKPIRWVATRGESHLSDAHGRDHLTKIKVALDKNKQIIAMRADTYANMGAYLSTFAPYIPTDCGSLMLGLLYDIPNIYAQVQGVFTNSVPVDAYRGAGRPEACYATDRAMELTARAIGEDPIKFRLRHLIKGDKIPMTNPMRNYYDSGNFPETYQKGLDLADIANFETRKQASLKNNKYRGIGVCYYSESCGAGGGESAKIVPQQDGSVHLMIGSQNNGQGHNTTFTQIISTLLQIPNDKILIIQGDTNSVATGNGTGGSRMSSEAGSATKKASEDLITNAKKFMGNELNINDIDINYQDGIFTAPATNISWDLGELTQKAMDKNITIQGEGQFKGISKTFPNGIHICEVEVDKDTGEIAVISYIIHDDFGNVINPITLEAQVHGGVAQGLGQALMEQIIYDENGQLLTASFMDYAIPRADQMPQMTFHYTTKYPTKNNILGVKGAGEAGAIAAPSAIVNAVENAIFADKKFDNLPVLQMPLTSESVWRAMKFG